MEVLHNSSPPFPRDDFLFFTVNGERFEVPEIDPSTTLLEFLRSSTSFKSVKLGCGEGGCGACVVLLSKYDPILKQVESFTVSSCLTLLCSINGCSVTTSEGIGNSKDGFHPWFAGTGTAMAVSLFRSGTDIVVPMSQNGRNAVLMRFCGRNVWKRNVPAAFAAFR